MSLGPRSIRSKHVDKVEASLDVLSAQRPEAQPRTFIHTFRMLSLNPISSFELAAL